MDYQAVYASWLNNPALNEEGKRELAAISGHEMAKEYRFGAELAFGTAGLRGIIGYGTNMMNIYTVMRATQGLAEFIKTRGEEAKKRGVVISYDTRRKSDEFARAAAGVLAEDAKKFSKVMVLVLLPATQGIYGFVMALVGQGAITSAMSVGQGWAVFAAVMPLAITGLISAIYQGKTSTSCIYAVAKDEKISGKLIMFPAMVETYAIFGFVISLLFTLSL